MGTNFPTGELDPPFLTFPDTFAYRGFVPGPNGTILGIAPYTNGENALLSIAPNGIGRFITETMGASFPTGDPTLPFITFPDTLPYYGFAPKTGGGFFGVSPSTGGNVLNRISPFGVSEVPLLPLGVTIPLGPGYSVFVPDTTEYFGFISAAQLLPPANGGGGNGGSDNGGGNNGGGTPVPEPASLLLLLAGLALLALTRRAAPARAAA